ncbi:MAG TPA: glutamate racemase [Elusimicrobiota bacterium]|nr:glutamate racemase [Elusimicrobiota bacterium]
MMSARAPIGIFDSGAGGLTVLQAVARRMPGENLIYFGDTANLPYGTKSPRAVIRASVAVTRFLARQGIKALVVACNTSSALALPDISRAAKGIPVVGVIGPGARAAAQAARGRPVGVVATAATVSSGAYARAVRSRAPRSRVISIACPLFVPLVEEGLWSGRIAQEVAARYLPALRRARVKTLILGCTHYPLLKGVIRRALGRGVRLVDSGEETARELEALLKRRGLRRPGKASGRRRFYVSDDPARFSRLARRFLGRGVGKVILHGCE